MERGGYSTGLDRPLGRLERRSVAVVGGGIVGVSAAYAAAVLGGGRVKVSLYEAAEAGHSGAASYDATRVFRYLNGPDPVLTAWARESHALWDRVGRLWGSAALHPVGVLFLVERRDGASVRGRHVWPYDSAEGWLEDSLRVMDEHNAPYRRLSAPALARVYPQFHGPAIEQAVVDPGAGFVEASKAVSALLRLGIGAGVEYHPNTRVTRVEAVGDGCVLHTDGGGEARFDSSVIAANGWVGDILPALAGTLALTEQPLVYLKAPVEAPELSVGRMPVFISLSSDCYGFPIHDGVIKVADDNPGRAIDHPDERREAEEGYVGRVVSKVSRFVPALKDASVDRTHVCFYDRSEDGRFILDAWDEEARVVYGCGMSGRAFKFGPVIGERLARFALSGRRPSDLEGFRAR